jgi:hypothetical protein
MNQMKMHLGVEIGLPWVRNISDNNRSRILYMDLSDEIQPLFIDSSKRFPKLDNTKTKINNNMIHWRH